MQVCDETENHTYIDLSDCGPLVDEEKMELLNNYNRNRIKGRKRVNKQKARQEDALALLQSIASTLRLTDSQKKEAKRIFKMVESRQRGLKQVAFAVCVIVVNQAVPEGEKRYWHDHKKKNNDERFVEFVEDHNINPLPAIMQVKREVDL